VKEKAPEEPFHKAVQKGGKEHHTLKFDTRKEGKGSAQSQTTGGHKFSVF